MLKSINPYNGLLLSEIEEDSTAAWKEKLNRSGKAFPAWKRLSIEERAGYFYALEKILLQEKEKHARLISLEMGKLLADSVAELEKCAWVCRYYADHAARMLSTDFISTHPAVSQIKYEPLGPVLAVMPWNFPYWQVFRFAVPALLAGNTALLKHASNVPQCSLEIENIFLRAGFPPGVFQSLMIGAGAVPAVIRQEAVKAVTLTGSEAAGRKVAAVAGKAIKKTVLELGGSDPFIVLPDAPLESTVEQAVAARLLCGGQSCIAAKRFIVHESLLSDFTKKLVERLGPFQTGDPLDPTTTQGPLARVSLATELWDQVTRLRKQAGEPLFQSFPYQKEAAFFPMMVFSPVKSSSVAFKEELFGPVFCVSSFKTDKEAVRLANKTKFGLAAAVWSADLKRAYALADQVEAGSVYVNQIVRSDVRLPFGGIKSSGYGRELGAFGIREFVNIKTLHGR